MLPADCLNLNFIPTFLNIFFIKWWNLDIKGFPAYSRVLTPLVYSKSQGCPKSRVDYLTFHN